MSVAALANGARNVIDARRAIKFKHEMPIVDVAARGGQQAKAPASKRAIRTRLTVRGFKDSERGDIDRYAGTSSRDSQKMLVSEAVDRGWDIATADVSKACLQGVTYKELAELTGEPIREVDVYLLASDVPILRKVPRYDDFNPVKDFFAL